MCRRDKHIIKQITEGDYHFHARHWADISADAIDLVKKLMTVDPEYRLSAAEALNHKWMEDPAIVQKAEKLMDMQRQFSPQRMETDGGMHALSGILPEEWDSGVLADNSNTDKSMSPTVKEPAAKNGVDSATKRKMDEAGEAACKKVRR